MDNDVLFKKRLRLIGIAFGLLLVCFIGWKIYQSVTFRFLSTDPDTSSVATVSPYFKITFNKALSKSTKVSVSPQNTSADVSIDGSSVVVNFYDSLDSGTTYHISLSNITAQSGQKLTDRTFSFQPQDLDQSQLSPGQQQALQARQGQYNDLFKTYGLLKLLPFTSGGNEFTITYTVNSSSKNLQPVVFVTTGNDQGKADALTWIKEVGFDPAKYTIVYKTN